MGVTDKCEECGPTRLCACRPSVPGTQKLKCRQDQAHAARQNLQLKPGRVVPDIRKLQGRDWFDFCHLRGQSSRWLYVSLLTARTREVSGAQMFRNSGEFA